MKKKYIILAMMSLFLFVACSSNEEEQQTNNQTGVIALKAEVVPMNTLQEGEQSSSRAISSEYENTINNIHVVVFDSDGNQIYHVYSPMYMENPYTTLLNLGSAHAGETVTIYAIANIGEPDLFPVSNNSNTKTQFESLNLRPADMYSNDVQLITQGSLALYSYNGTHLTATNNSEAPIMVCGPMEVTVANNGLTSATLRFTRQDTKISLNIIPQKMKIIKYRICNIPTISYLFSKGENVPSVGYANIPYVELEEEDQSKTIKASFHVFENYNDNIVGALKQTDRYEGNIPVGSHPTYLEIIGQPDGFTDQYRYCVYLGGVSSDNEIQYHKITLLRNYEYYLTVKLAGDGTGDPRVSKVE